MGIISTLWPRHIRLRMPVAWSRIWNIPENEVSGLSFEANEHSDIKTTPVVIVDPHTPSGATVQDKIRYFATDYDDTAGTNDMWTPTAGRGIRLMGLSVQGVYVGAAAAANEDIAVWSSDELTTMGIIVDRVFRTPAAANAVDIPIAIYNFGPDGLKLATDSILRWSMDRTITSGGYIEVCAWGREE